ncbi:MAG: signal peptide peptidase SppA [Phycisphaerae bacterium]
MTASAALSQTPNATTKPATGPATTKAAGAPLKTIAQIRMSGEVEEGPPGFSLFDDGSYMTTSDWLQRLAKARLDKDVAAVAIEIDNPELSWAQAQELADAVKRINAVKPVYVYITEASTAEYLVGSSARHISMEPTGELDIVGLAAEMVFFRGTLDWIGIKPQMIQAGRFKGASEPFMNKKPSAEVIQNHESLLDDLYDQLCGQIADGRKLTQDQVKKAIDSGPFTAEAAQKAGLVDELIGKLEWRDAVGRRVDPKGQVKWLDAYGRKPKASLDLSNPFAIIGMLSKGKGGEEPRDPTIALICADGMIVSGQGGEMLFGGKLVGSRTMVDAFESMRKDSRVKAVVFRIDSPGGSALASEQIYQAVKKCAASKPVIVSISALGASGGYYIASGGTEIMADPAGIVGSIGVVGGKLSLSGFDNSIMDKIGVSTYSMTRGQNAGMRLSRPWDEREEKIIREMVDKTYRTFEDRVKESRGGKIRNIDDVAQGRVFTARQAVRNGLIDEVGGLKDAIAAAQKAGKVGQTYHLITLPRPKTLMDLLSGDSSSEETLAPSGLAAAYGKLTEGSLLRHAAGARSAAVAHMLNMAHLMGRENVLAVMPYYLSVSK